MIVCKYKYVINMQVGHVHDCILVHIHVHSIVCVVYMYVHLYLIQVSAVCVFAYNLYCMYMFIIFKYIHVQY